MELMRVYDNSQSIVISCLVTLGNMGFTTENRMALGEAGALKIMLKVMEKHMEDLDIMTAGYQALSNLTVGNVDNQRVVLGWGVRYMLSAMRSFASHEKLMTGTRGTLENLASLGGEEKQYIKAEAKAMGIKISKTKSTSCKQQ